MSSDQGSLVDRQRISLGQNDLYGVHIGNSADGNVNPSPPPDEQTNIPTFKTTWPAHTRLLLRQPHKHAYRPTQCHTFASLHLRRSRHAWRRPRVRLEQEGRQDRKGDWVSPERQRISKGELIRDQEVGRDLKLRVPGSHGRGRGRMSRC